MARRRTKADVPGAGSLKLEPIRLKHRRPGKRYDWSPGPGAHVEIVKTGGGEVPYKTNCTLQWRPALRSPMEEVPLTEEDYRHLRERLTGLKAILNKGDRLRSENPGAIAQLQKNWEMADADLVSGATPLGQHAP